MSQSGHSNDYDSLGDVMSDAGRAFIDDEGSIRSSFHGHPDNEDFHERGSRVSYHAEGPKKNKVRAMPRVLKSLSPLGLYCDYQKFMPWTRHVPRISHLVAPYTFYSTLVEPQNVTKEEAPCNVFFDSRGQRWMSDMEKQIEFARRFASYGTPGGGQREPLRRLDRMKPMGDDDPFNFLYISPAAEVIAAHNVLENRDGLDFQPYPEVIDEIVCKGDFVTESKLRGCSMGGLPGLASVDLFVFEEVMSNLEISPKILKLYKDWNFGVSRASYFHEPIPSVETEISEFITNGKSKTARVAVDTFSRERHLDEMAMLEHVHPDIKKQLRNPMVSPCKAPPDVTESKQKRQDKLNLFDAHIISVPNRVRDKNGKLRFVMCSILRIRSTLPGCDPLLALRRLETADGFVMNLLEVVQEMMFLLEMPGNVSFDALFCATANGANLASISHEANLPLAFFNYLRNEKISDDSPSPFAADWMGQRIDVYNKEEVAIYQEGLRVMYNARRYQYEKIVEHTTHDMKSKTNSRLPLPLQTVDWRLAYPGHSYIAVPKVFVREAVEGRETSAYDLDKFEEFFRDNSDPNYFFFSVDRTPLTRGYALMMQAMPRPEESPERLKVRAQKAEKIDTRIDDEELQCVHYCSKRFELYSTFAVTPRDPYAAFLHRTTPYPTEGYMQANLNSLTVTEREYYAYLTLTRAHAGNLRHDEVDNIIVETAYGSTGHPMHDSLQKLQLGSDVRMLHSHSLDVIGSACKKHINFGANTSLEHLKQNSSLVLHLAKMDENPPRAKNGQTIAEQHLSQHQQSLMKFGKRQAIVNDDSQSALRHLLQFNNLNMETWSTNYAIYRLQQGSILSIWSSTREGGYGNCAQICDMGGSSRVFPIDKSGSSEPQPRDWDRKSPGAGADTAFNIIGHLYHGFVRYIVECPKLRKFAFSKKFNTEYQHVTLMSLKRIQGVVYNANGKVNKIHSEHKKKFGHIGSMLEIGKLTHTKEAQSAMYANLEAGLGQSGTTSSGAQEQSYTSTLQGEVVNIETNNSLPITLLSSNYNSVQRPASLNDGSRVVLVPAACADTLGRIVEKITGNQAPIRPRRKRTLDDYNDDRPKSEELITVDDFVVRGNMSIFFLESQNLIFSYVHRGLCLTRTVKSGFGMFVWSETRNGSSWLTTNMRKKIYHFEDKMSRNSGGPFEGIIYGLHVRSVLQRMVHRRFMQTEIRSKTDCETKLQHVLVDAIQAFCLVPQSTTVLLSGLQLYMSLIILCHNVMVVGCMVLFYLDLVQNCPLYILALVVRGRVRDLSPEELKQYHDFAGFLHHKLLGSFVPVGFIHTSFSADGLHDLLSGRGDLHGIDTSPSVYICDKYFSAKTTGSKPNMTTEMMLSKKFAGEQREDVQAKLFWTAAIEGCRVPVPDGRTNEKDHFNFTALHQCTEFYKEVRGKLSSDGKTNSLGLITAFLRICGLPDDVSRYDLVKRMLEPWAEVFMVSLDDFHNVFHRNGILVQDWSAPILNEKGKVKATMLEWAVQCSPTGECYEPHVGLAVDVLWLVISQGLFANEWKMKENERHVVIHIRNMSGFAQGLLTLCLHSTIPKAAIPACIDGGVVLSEPSMVPEDEGAAIVIPYRSRIHVDSGDDGSGFTHKYMREPKNMIIVNTKDSPILISKYIQLKDRDTKTIGSYVIDRVEICPFPPESVAHMLPLMPSLMYVFQGMYRQFPELVNCAGSYWTLAMRLFGSNGNEDTLGVFPVALTQEALEEEVPCFTYRDGYCFVLTIDGPNVILRPVDIDTTAGHGLDDETLCAHSSFALLPMTEHDKVIIPAEQLSHAMSGGLVLRDGGAVYQPPALLRRPTNEKGEIIQVHVPASGTPIPFTFMPIVRFQCLLLLEETQSRSSFRTYQEKESAPLVLGVVHRRSDNNKFMKNGRYQARFFCAEEDAGIVESMTTFDYIFAAECLLRDGREVFYTFTEAQFADCVRIMADPNIKSTNMHVDFDRNLRKSHEIPQCETFALRCHYTVSHVARSERLGDTHVRIAFSVNDKLGKSKPVILYADVPLFDAENKSRLHVLAPACTIVPNLVW
jgi:hypothetical protein